MKWLDKIPYLILIIAAVFMGMAPYPAKPEPHLIEKLGILFQGSLVKPIDIFDLFWHSFPLILLIMKFVRDQSVTDKS